jgi:glucosamine--fructose-6-phosphate aminotransferase (isomerizing)
MCGIVGYNGNKKACPILINGLKKLEYRGYDSAGISVMESNNIIIKKDKGRVANLENIEGIESLNGTLGIAHTRWATHGKPSKENAHPHMDNSKTFSVVHNGIIENYKELRDFLESKNYTFYSDTDTETIPNLIHYYYEKENNFLKAVNLACKDLKGSYALEVINKNNPDTLIVTRKDSPLVIGTKKDETFISSDIPALISFTNNFYFLNDKEYAVITKGNIEFYDFDLNKLTKKSESVELAADSADKGKFEDYMLKEIFEQPKAIRETIGTSLNGNSITFDGLSLDKNFLRTINQIYIVACGTAMHAGLAVKANFEHFLNVPVCVDVASEFRYRDPLINEKTLCIYISQSGETADTIAALKLAKSKNAKTIAVTNVIESSITREADYFIYTHAGPEIAVASTKAYTSQVVLLNIMALYFAEILESISSEKIKELKNELLSLPEKAEKVLKSSKDLQEFAQKIYKEKDVFFIGRGIDYPVSMEASLKLKEISYIHSESFAAGELKHGPIALIENGTTVVSILTDPNLVEKTVSNIQEVITRGAKSFVVTNQPLDKTNFDFVISIPQIDSIYSPVLSIIPLQLLAYYITKEKGLDVDKPRNLAKSVTVE